jgi:HNH endonuclease
MMRHINEFPVFSVFEMDDLRRKLVIGVISEDFKAAHPAHVARAALEGREWVKYPCWLGASKWDDGKGFKKFKFKGHTLYIHRASYECFNGPVPDGKLVDHLCRVRGCRQPAHLEAITPKENILRGAQQAALIRGDAPCPISAKEINPHFFEQVGGDDIGEEHWRRQRAGRDVRRFWMEDDGALPPAPEGFKWEPSSSLGPITHFLNPIRPKMDSINQRYQEEAYRRFVAQVAAYEPRAQVAGVDYPDTTNDVGCAPEIPVAFNPEWLQGDSSKKMLIRQPITESVLHHTGTPFHKSDEFSMPNEFGPSLIINPTPVEPDWNWPIAYKLDAPKRFSVMAFFEYVGCLFLCFMPRRVRDWFLR